MKKKRQPIRYSAVLAEVRTPKYRPQVVASVKAYSRKGKKGYLQGRVEGREGIAKAA